MKKFWENLAPIAFLDDAYPVHTFVTEMGEKLTFTMLGKHTEFRVRTLETKEPETISWIRGFSSTDVFWDVGANIGLYSIFAAIIPRAKVFAFEPVPANSYVLALNAQLEPEADLTIFPCAVSNRTGFSFWSPPNEVGSADTGLHKVYERESMAMWMETLDSLQENGIPSPTKLKIDVDGFEPEILEAGRAVLKEPKLSSVMIEVNEADCASRKEILRIMDASGFSRPLTRHAPYFDNNHYLPTSNYIFNRG